MSGQKDFRKRRRESGMDDRESKRRRSDLETQPRSNQNGRDSNENVHENYRNRNNNNNSNFRGQYNGGRNNNYTDRNNNSYNSNKNRNRSQHRPVYVPKGIYPDSQDEKNQKKRITIQFTSKGSTGPTKPASTTIRFNFANNNNIPKSTEQSKVSNTSTDATQPAGSAAPALPGYYYDPDVNRYFKRPPPGTAMYKRYQETLKKAEEKERQVQEEKKALEEKARIDRGVNISILNEKFKSPFSTIVRRETGRTQRASEFVSKSMEFLFKRFHDQYSFPSTIIDTECYDMVAQREGELMMTGLRDGQLMLDKLEWKDEDNNFYVNGLSITESSPISSVRFNPKYDISPSVYTATILGGGRSGELKFYNPELQIQHATKLKKGSMWCHEWSPTEQYISMGITKGAMVIDPRTSKIISCFTEKSDVFAQSFTENGAVLLNGSRDGKIRTFDIRHYMQRTPFGSHAPIMKHTSSITCLKVLRDENYLLANSINGVIALWDRRVNKIVTRMDYFNEMTSNKFEVAPDEDFVFIGGQDKKVHIWNLKTGHLVHTLGPFATPIKSLVFGNSWIHDTVRVPGFWTFINKSVHFYGIK